MKRRFSLVLALATAVMPWAVEAASLVPGGYLMAPPTGSDAASADTDWSVPSFALSRGAGDVRIGFTPRGGGSVLLSDPDQRGSSGLKGFGLGMSDSLGSLGRLDTRPAAASDAQRANLQTVSPLSIGGAISWSDWTIGGAYARGQLIGGATDLVGASIGFGPITARFGYGSDSSASEPEGRELWVVGTDLAASSWLTLEGDLALSTTQRAVEPTTIGRIGIRLNF